MALNRNLKLIIETLAENQTDKARKVALAALKEDDAQGNRRFVEHYLPKLEALIDGPLEVPYQYRGFIVAEDVGKTFRADRYFLSDREKGLYEHIVRMRQVGGDLAAMGFPYLNASLMHGESGTGKTLFARFVAHELSLPFVYVNFAGLVDSYLGSTAKNISRAFEYVSGEPCVFLIDEIDCISMRRSKAGGGSEKEMSRTTITLMQELDRLTNLHVVLAATNRLDMLDEALLRRFPKKHEVAVFGAAEKEAMLRRLLISAEVGFDRDNVSQYSRAHTGPQAQCVSDAVEAIARSLQTGEPLHLPVEGEAR